MAILVINQKDKQSSNILTLPDTYTICVNLVGEVKIEDGGFDDSLLSDIVVNNGGFNDVLQPYNIIQNSN